MTPGSFVLRWRWPILIGYLAGAALLVALAHPAEPGANEQTTFLPAWAPSRQAVEAIAKAFPASSGFSDVAIVVERPGGPLADADFRALEDLARRITDPNYLMGDSPDVLRGLHVMTPGSLPIPANPLTGQPIARNPLVSELSAAGQAALIRVTVPANFITTRAVRAVDHIRALVADDRALRQLGLNTAVTGSAVFGRDYVLAAERSHHRTVLVTLIAVIVMLLAVYRAPLAAVVTLGAVSIAAVIALKLLDLADHFALHIGTAEKIFVIVLLYGAGVDYSLLLISRHREHLDASGPKAAVTEALDASALSILAAGGINVTGMMMLVFTQYGIFRTTGPAVALSLVVALLASLTLVPALLAIFGRRLFWPGRTLSAAAGPADPARPPRARLWPRIARFVCARPGVLLPLAVAVLAAPAVRGTRITWVYDTLTDLGKDYGAVAALDVVKRHWTAGEIAPVRILVRCDRPLDRAGWAKLSGSLTGALNGLKGVQNVRSLSQPMGSQVNPVASAVISTLGAGQVASRYIASDGTATFMEAVLDTPAFSLQAMRLVNGNGTAGIRQVVQAAADGVCDRLRLGRPQVFIAGASADMADLRLVTEEDFYRIVALVLGVIIVVLLVLLRDPVLALFVTAASVLAYLATLGVTYWVFVGLLGQEGLDWKVRVFLFVVATAVGVDYSIFLTARLGEESRRLPLRQATQRALATTGPVISSAGLIMAATLGSLLVGHLRLLQQLGFALALGMLIDTFVVRPLILPSFVLLTGRTGKHTLLGRREDDSRGENGSRGEK